MSEKAAVAHVYQALSAVMAVMAKEGIEKSRKNTNQGYAFRGIDEIYNSLSAHVAENKLLILPRVIDRSCTERATRNDGVVTYTILTVEFDLVSAVDGSQHMIRTMGEAMDSGDKSTNKSMSAAMKYACLMVFMIPTKADNDADASHPQKASPRTEARARQNAPVALPRPAGTTPAAGPPRDDAWLEWALVHANNMQAAKSAGELKAVFATAWREAEYRNAPAHIRSSLEKAKNDLKGRFAEDASGTRAAS